MISNVIVDYINGAITGYDLSKGNNLFAEQGQGEKTVVISLTSDPPDSSYLSFVRHAALNIIVSGWGAVDGSILTNLICKKIEAMTGEYSYVVKSGVIETYNIAAVSVRNWATIIRRDNNFVYSANIEVHYKSE